MDAQSLIALLGQETLKTLYMTVLSTVVAYVIGLPIGVSLIVTSPNGIKPAPIYNRTMGIIVNVIRSVPFLILMIALLPYIRIVIGTSIGPNAITAALVVAAAPFVARLVEASLLEVDPGVIEAAQAMGASTFQIIRKVLLLEGRPSLLNGAAVVVHPHSISTGRLEEAMRICSHPIVVRTADDSVKMDVRTIFEEDFETIAEMLAEILG